MLIQIRFLGVRDGVQISFQVFSPGEIDSPNPNETCIAFVFIQGNERVFIAFTNTLGFYIRGRWGMSTYSDWHKLN